MSTQIERENRINDLKRNISSLKKDLEILTRELYRMNEENNFLKFMSTRNNIVNTVDTVNTEINNIEKIVISDYCLQSCPCQHDCTIYYKDDSIKKIRHNGRYIAQTYFDILNDKDKMHFYTYLK